MSAIYGIRPAGFSGGPELFAGGAHKKVCVLPPFGIKCLTTWERKTSENEPSPVRQTQKGLLRWNFVPASTYMTAR